MCAGVRAGVVVRVVVRVVVPVSTNVLLSGVRSIESQENFS